MEHVTARLTLSYPTAVVHATVQRTGPPTEQTLANAPTDTRTPVRPVMCVAPTEPDARFIATAVPALRAIRMPTSLLMGQAGVSAHRDSICPTGHVQLVRPPDARFIAMVVPAEHVIVRRTLSYPTAVALVTARITSSRRAVLACVIPQTTLWHLETVVSVTAQIIGRRPEIPAPAIVPTILSCQMANACAIRQTTSLPAETLVPATVPITLFYPTDNACVTAQTTGLATVPADVSARRDIHCPAGRALHVM